MKVTPIKQRDDSACGPTSIEMTLHTLGVPHTYNDIVKTSSYKKTDGMTNEKVAEVLSKMGTQVTTQSQTTWEELMKANTKNSVIIVSWMLKGYIGHLSVVERVNKESIILAEPTTGAYEKMHRIQFLRLWMDYDGMWFPDKNTDIQLRWMCIVTK